MRVYAKTLNKFVCVFYSCLLGVSKVAFCTPKGLGRMELQQVRTQGWVPESNP